MGQDFSKGLELPRDTTQFFKKRKSKISLGNNLSMIILSEKDIYLTQVDVGIDFDANNTGMTAW